MKRLFVLLVLLLTACVTQPGPTAYPAAQQALPYPGAVVRSYLDHITAPTVAPAFVAQSVETGAYPGPWMPVVIRDGVPARPTATVTATSVPPTATNTAAPPTATYTALPPTDTPDTSGLPVIPDNGFEAERWWQYSDHGKDLLVGRVTFFNTSWVPFEWPVLQIASVSYSVPEDEEPSPLPSYGNRELVISDPFFVPAGTGPFYITGWVLIQSNERMCDPPFDSLRVYVGPEQFDSSFPIRSGEDTEIGLLPLCVGNNTNLAYVKISVDYDFSRFAGRTVRLKILGWEDFVSDSFVRTDKWEFTTVAPALLGAQDVRQPDDAFSLPGTGTSAPDWDDMVLPER